MQLSQTGRVADQPGPGGSNNDGEDDMKLGGKNWRNWLDIQIQWRLQHLLKWRKKKSRMGEKRDKEEVTYSC